MVRSGCGVASSCEVTGTAAAVEVAAVTGEGEGGKATHLTDERKRGR